MSAPEERVSPTPRQVAGNQIKLDRAAKGCKRILSAAHKARSLAALTQADPAIVESAREAGVAAREVLTLLIAAGPTPPLDNGPLDGPDADAAQNMLAARLGDIEDLGRLDRLDLGALAKLSDPDAMADNRALLTLLEQAQAVAERLDLRRGCVVGEDIPLQPGESRGTDLAETISEIAFRLRYEISGPVGKD